MNSTTSNRGRQGAARIPLHIAHSMLAIVEYLYSDEFSDYQARTKEARNGHVFRDLLTVRRFLQKIGVANQKQGS